MVNEKCLQLVGFVMQAIGSATLAAPIYFGSILKIKGDEAFGTEHFIAEAQRWRFALRFGFAVYLLGYVPFLIAAWL